MKEEELMEKCNCNECADDCHCGDDCHCEHSEPIIIEMEDLEGQKVKVEVVGTFEDSGKYYAVVNDLDNTDNSYIFEIQSTEQGDMLVSIDDEQEFERLCKVVEEFSN